MIQDIGNMAGMTANHLNSWYRDNAFCGRCGVATEHDNKLRMVKCPSCGNMIKEFKDGK